ncbi:hypothetical protein IQ273_26290 [Nodosilinea sp. LEGE 07298]|uniref:hypothetical protein n=1 Tax=Nodosilinea sp. LEGE 07298 TaxID=2777970 RepID=UPI00187EDBA0|nr:hypothetical protein [Nodosilinea sp. LEGE 07298]MBE9112901.1 hypothetical protein [Nodosilinea sp. LEGE 07298]
MEALLEGDPKTLRLELAEFVLENIHHELTAFDIWHYLLEERGYSRREWGKEPSVLSAIERTNKAYLSTLQEAKIGGEVLPRSEVSLILEKITASSEKGGVLVVGEAGIGKSGAISQVLDILKDDGIPFLAFRIDRLEPEVIPDAVGTQLGLPASPPTVLANIAQNRDCVLVIDQLDAVSLVSGRNPQFFDCISQLINQAKAHPNIHLLLACRKFDLENDNRFKHITGQNGIAEVVNISRLTTSTVKEVVSKSGIEASRLNEKQLNLLSLPLHLSLLAEVTEEINNDILDFKSAKDLYDRFWKHKQQKIRERLGRSIQWTQVIDNLCNYMSDKQILSVPESHLDELTEDVSLMASEHILIWENARISFFHEGFFDYAFARRFSTVRQTLSDLLRSGEQHLFRRAQVRQILFHQRDVNFTQYLADLKEILFSSDIRSHLKVVTYSLLATISDPQEEEWEIIYPLITDSSNLYIEKSWEILRTSAEWFQLVDSLGVIEKWLSTQKNDITTRTLILLSIMQNHLPNRVAELAESYLNCTDASCESIGHLFRFSKLESGRRFFEFFLCLIDKGVFDETREAAYSDRDFWMLIYDLPKKNPGWACEAIGHYFNRCLEVSNSKSVSNPFDNSEGTLFETSFYEECLYESAQSEPQSFVENVFPFILSVIGLNAIQDSGYPLSDSIWRYRSYGRGYGFESNLLNCFEIALSKLALNQPAIFCDFVSKNLYDSQFETIQYLLIRAYTANGKEFADEAIGYLLEEPSRLQTGYEVCSGNGHAAPHWATRLLIEATTPYCSSKILADIENLLLNYYPEWERSADCRLLRGYAQFILLDAIDPTRISESVHRRLQEWRRKFTSTQLLKEPGKIEPPQSISASFIGSPIPETAAERISDEQWLKVITQYQHDDAGAWFKKHGELVGGARQVSQFLLKKQVKKEPVRFAQLIQRFPETANIAYFKAVLDGISEVGIDPNNALKACKKCHDLSKHPCGKAICWLVQKLSDLSWDQEIYDIISWYVLNDPDPVQELWQIESQSKQLYHDEAVIKAGINSVRGDAAIAISKLVFSDKSRASYFLPTLREMVKDPSIAVRSCVAEALIATLNYDRDVAVGLFLELLETDNVLMGTRSVEVFLHYALRTHFQILKPIVEQMLSSDLPSVATVGARQACVAAMHTEEALPLAELCLNGTQTHRLAAAEVFVTNLRSAYLKEFCENSLIQLFSDPSSEVRAKAAKCFFRLEVELDSYSNLIDQFVETEAFSDGGRDLIWALEKTTSKLPKSTYRICERFIQSINDENAQKRSGALRDVSSVSQLLVRLYSQSGRDLVLQSQCLDLIDQMIEIGAYGLEKSLAPFER